MLKGLSPGNWKSGWFVVGGKGEFVVEGVGGLWWKGWGVCGGRGGGFVVEGVGGLWWEAPNIN